MSVLAVCRSLIADVKPFCPLEKPGLFGLSLSPNIASVCLMHPLLFNSKIHNIFMIYSHISQILLSQFTHVFHQFPWAENRLFTFRIYDANIDA